MKNFAIKVSVPFLLVSLMLAGAGCSVGNRFQDASEKPISLFRDVVFSPQPGMSFIQTGESQWTIQLCEPKKECQQAFVEVLPTVDVRKAFMERLTDKYGLTFCRDLIRGGTCVVGKEDEIPDYGSTQIVSTVNGTALVFALPDKAKKYYPHAPNEAFALALRGRTILVIPLRDEDQLFSEQLALRGWELDKAKAGNCEKAAASSVAEELSDPMAKMKTSPLDEKFAKLNIDQDTYAINENVIGRLYSAAECGDDAVREMTSRNLEQPIPFHFDLLVHGPVSVESMKGWSDDFVCSTVAKKTESVSCGKGLLSGESIHIAVPLKTGEETRVTVDDAIKTETLLPNVDKVLQY